MEKNSKIIMIFIAGFMIFMLSLILFVAYAPAMIAKNEYATYETEAYFPFEVEETQYDGVDGYMITSYIGNDSDVIVPADYKGMPILAIGERAFGEVQGIDTIEAKSGIREVKEYAFYHCDASVIIIPNSVEKIGRNAFEGAEELLEVWLPDDLKCLEESVFEGCTNLETIYGMENLLLIKAHAFSGCSSLTLEIPSCIIWMEDSALLSVKAVSNRENYSNIAEGKNAYSIVKCQLLLEEKPEIRSEIKKKWGSVLSADVESKIWKVGAAYLKMYVQYLSDQDYDTLLIISKYLREKTTEIDEIEKQTMSLMEKIEALENKLNSVAGDISYYHDAVKDGFSKDLTEEEIEERANELCSVAKEYWLQYYNIELP